MFEFSLCTFHHFQNFSRPRQEPILPRATGSCGLRWWEALSGWYCQWVPRMVWMFLKESQVKDQKLRLMNHDQCSTLSLFTVPYHLHMALIWGAALWSLHRTPPVPLHLPHSRPDNTILVWSSYRCELGKEEMITLQKLRYREVKRLA